MKSATVEIRNKLRSSAFLFDNEIISGDTYKSLSIYAVMTYLVLRRHADNSTSQCFLLLSTIAEEARSSRSSVKRAIDELKEVSLIEVEYREAQSSVFTLLPVQKVSPEGTYPTPGVSSVGTGVSSVGTTEGCSLKGTKTNTPERLFEDRFESIIEKEIFPYFLEQTGRSANLYTLTPPRLKCGVARFREALKKAINNSPDNAKELMRIAIDTLAASPWHMGRDPKTNGKKYSDWADVFGTTDKFEKWLDRSE